MFMDIFLFYSCLPLLAVIYTVCRWAEAQHTLGFFDRLNP